MSATKFSAEVRGALIERTAAGVSLDDACRALGLREATVKAWLTRGRREPSGAYAAFASAIESAREAARSRPEPMDEAELAQVVSQMARKGSVQAAKLRWEMLRADHAEQRDRPTRRTLAVIDEIAERRLRAAQTTESGS